MVSEMSVHLTKRSTERAAPVQAVGRAVDILYCLGSAGGPLTLTEIARRTELDKATTHRLLQTLAARDLVARSEPSGRYAPGPGVLRLALGLGSRNAPDLRTLARPYMERLVELSRETVGLGMLADGQHVYIAQAESPYEVRWVIRIGLSASLQMGAGPRALLAFLPPREQEAIIQRASFEGGGEGAPHDAEELRKLLAEIRRTGVSLNLGELSHTAAIAVPLFGKAERPLGTLAVGGPQARVTRQVLDELRQPLLTAAQELSRQLGYGG